MYRIQLGSDKQQQPEEVVSIIKPIDREKSNAEIEVNELVFDTNKLTIHKATGKPHSKGGTPVSLPDNAFIYSNYKKLDIKPNEVRPFAIKKINEGQTPAALLGKNVDIKNHNRLLSMLDKKEHDDISKNSAILNITRDIKEFVGPVAFLQESKKGYPNGLPDFAKNTAPVFNNKVKESITESKQYQPGGMVKPWTYNPYNPSAMFINPDNPIIPPSPFQKNRYNKLGQVSPTGNYYNTPDQRADFYNTWMNNTKALDPNANVSDVSSLQKYYANNPNYQPLVVDSMKRNGMTIHGQKLFGQKSTYSDNEYIQGFQDNDIDRRGPMIHNYEVNSLDELNGLPKIPKNPSDPTYATSPFFYYSGNGETYYNPIIKQNQNTNTSSVVNTTPTGSTPIDSGLKVPQISTTDSYMNSPHIGLSSMQLLDTALPWANALAVQKQYPLRQQIRRYTPIQESLSPEGALREVDRSVNSSANMMRVVDPRQATAISNNLYAKGLDAKSDIINKYNQSNIQTSNANANTIAQNMNNDQIDNLKFNKDYYDNVNMTNVRANEFKNMLFNQGRDNLNQNLTKVQEMNNMLNTQKLYPTTKRTADGKVINEPIFLPVKTPTGIEFKFNPNLNMSVEQMMNENTGSGENSVYLKSLIQQAMQDISGSDASRARAAYGFLAKTGVVKGRLGGYKRYLK